MGGIPAGRRRHTEDVRSDSVGLADAVEAEDGAPATFSEEPS